MRSLLRLLAVLLLPAVAACGAVSAAAPSQLEVARSAPPYPGAAGPFSVGPDSVTVLPRGSTAFPAAHRLVQAAVRSVELEMYELQRADLLDELVAARDRGLRVTVVTDPQVAVSAASAAWLRARGVDVAAYPVRPQMIDHVKLLVVDEGAAALVGGINWGDASARNHDVDLLLRGPAAADLHRVFVRDLVTCGRPLMVPPEQPDAAVEVVATLPTAAIRPLVLEAVEEARASIDLELYVLTDLGIVHALERARARGVRIRLLLDPTERPSDGPAAELRAQGVPVLLYRGRGELLHAKTMVVDGRTVVAGSANWSAGGFSRNHELDVVLPEAPAVAAVLVQAEDSDWAAAEGSDVPPPQDAGGADPEAA